MSLLEMCAAQQYTNASCAAPRGLLFTCKWLAQLVRPRRASYAPRASTYTGRETALVLRLLALRCHEHAGKHSRRPCCWTHARRQRWPRDVDGWHHDHLQDESFKTRLDCLRRQTRTNGGMLACEKATDCSPKMLICDSGTIVAGALVTVPCSLHWLHSGQYSETCALAPGACSDALPQCASASTSVTLRAHA